MVVVVVAVVVSVVAGIAAVVVVVDDVGILLPLWNHITMESSKHLIC